MSQGKKLPSRPAIAAQEVLFGGPAEPPEWDDRAEGPLRVLVSVKAAPNPSEAYGETVCVAGLRLDPGHEGWVRLYPVNFRFLEEEHTFRKYDVISLRATPANEARRESWRPHIDTIQTENHLDGWAARLLYLLPHASVTMCDLNRRARGGGPSLGLVHARTVDGLDVEEHPGWTSDEKRKIDGFLAQTELFETGRPKTALEAPQFRAFFRWRCRDESCDGHRQGLLDWEFTAFQRRLIGSIADREAAIRGRWLDQVCATERDVFFYVGNQAKRHHVFSVLGVVYPKRQNAPRR